MTSITLNTAPVLDAVESRNVRMTEFGAQLLGTHALELPDGHPVRAMISTLLRRYSNAPVITPPAMPLELVAEAA